MREHMFVCGTPATTFRVINMYPSRCSSGSCEAASQPARAVQTFTEISTQFSIRQCSNDRRLTPRRVGSREINNWRNQEVLSGE